VTTTDDRPLKEDQMTRMAPDIVSEGQHDAVPVIEGRCHRFS
jgi:hypothetical protein